MFKGFRQSYDADTYFADAATHTLGRIGVWATIEPAKRLAIRGLTFSVLMHWNVGEETYLDPSEARKPPKGIAWRNDLLYLCRSLQTR